MANDVTVSNKKNLLELLHSPAIAKRFIDTLDKKAPGFISSILSAVSINKQLAVCDPMSIINASFIAAAIDLPVNQSLGFCHLVPYSGLAQFQMGWRGYIQLAMRTGQYKTINVSPVYEGDIISQNAFTGGIVFNTDNKTKEKITGYVAYFQLLNGFEKYYYMTKDQAEKHGRKYSKSYSAGQWTKDFDAMALKTVIKMLISKYGIMSIEMQSAVITDQAVIKNDGEIDYIDNETETAKPMDDPFQAAEEKKEGEIK